jgi:hypothetical protein
VGTAEVYFMGGPLNGKTMVMLTDENDDLPLVHSVHALANLTTGEPAGIVNYRLQVSMLPGPLWVYAAQLFSLESA